MNEHFFIYNNQYFLSDQAFLSVDNRGFRFGDGLFETMRLYHGVILNIDYHFERLFHGMGMLQFDVPQNFSKEFFINQINQLLLKNSISENARIRIMVFRGNGNLYEIENNSPDFIIETFTLTGKIELNEKGISMDIFPGAKKACDSFSNLKSNNGLPSAMARLFAKKNNLDDAIILNCYGRVCESSIANLFLVKDKNIYTPPLSEGCIAGTLRRWMLERFSSKEYKVEEKVISIEDLLNADELFLTNSIYLIKWIEKFNGKIYNNNIGKEIFQKVIQNI